MRYVVEVPDLASYKTACRALQTAQNIEEALGPVQAQNVVMGMQYQLGCVAASVIEINQNGELAATDIIEDLYGLIGTALVFVKAITPEPEIPNATEGQAES